MARKQIIPGLSYLSFSGILLSIIIGILSCLFVPSKEVNLLITMMGILVTFVYDMYSVLQTVSQKIDSYEEYIRASSILNSVANLKTSKKNSDSQKKILVDVISERLDRFGGEIRKMIHGQLTLDGWINIDERTLILARCVKKTLWATCLWSDNPIKEAQEQEYLKLLNSAVKDRGVVIKRLFLITQSQLSDIDFKNRYKQDRKQGIKVKYLLVEDWSADGTEPDPFDFGIWDGEILWRYRGRECAELYFAPQQYRQIGKCEKIFNKIWSKAKTL